MPSFDFSESATNGVELPLLLLHIDLDGVGHQVVRAAPGGVCQAVKLPLDLGCNADADGCSACASHAHKLAQRAPQVKGSEMNRLAFEPRPHLDIARVAHRAVP